MLLLIDLDNTVLYSHRHMISDPVIWVEQLNGKQQSFVSERTYRFYTSQDWLDVVPITTRTLKQYERLEGLFAAFKWNDALICNGSIMLKNGKEDKGWTKESMNISEADRPALHDAYSQAVALCGEEAIISEKPFMFYVKTDDVDKNFEALLRQVDQNHLVVLRDSRKIYCIPKSLSKGMAAERYKARYGYKKFIAAGDSAFDIPMLKKADICICPSGLEDFNPVGKRIVCEGLFSDEVCGELEHLGKEE